MSVAEVEAAYKIGRRIEAEERALDAASVVFTSTQEEVAKQWGTYDGWVCMSECKLWLTTFHQLRSATAATTSQRSVLGCGEHVNTTRVSLGAVLGNG
jgi:hypothetical protein